MRFTPYYRIGLGTMTCLKRKTLFFHTTVRAAKIDRLHEVSARKVSRGLMSETELAVLMEPYFNGDVVISDDRLHLVSGIKK